LSVFWPCSIKAPKLGLEFFVIAQVVQSYIADVFVNLLFIFDKMRAISSVLHKGS